MTMKTENDNKNLNVPNLRFPEFSGEWEKTTLGKTCNVLMCKRILASQTNTESGVPFYKIGTIGGAPDAYISKELFDIYKAKYNYPQKGEVMITCAGTVGKTIIFDGNDAYYQDSNIVWIDNPTNKIDNTFLYHYFSQIDWSKLNTTTIVRIYNDDLRQLKISYPSTEEQKKISHLLNLVNQRIATQIKIIEKLESLIKGLCQKLFRFKEYTTYFLGDICSITTGKLDANAMVENGKYPFFTCAEEVFNIANYAFDTEALLISGNGANLGYIHYYNGKFNAYQRTYVLDKFTIDINYIRLYLETFLKNRIEQEKNIGNTPYIVLGTLSKMKIKVPNILTQQKIVKTLTSLKDKLSNEKLTLEKYKEQKWYLLSNLFI